MSTLEQRVIFVINDALGSQIDESKLADELDADSLDQLGIVMGLEEEFDIAIHDDEFENLKSAENYVDIVKGKV